MGQTRMSRWPRGKLEIAFAGSAGAGMRRSGRDGSDRRIGQDKPFVLRLLSLS